MSLEIEEDIFRFHLCNELSYRKNYSVFLINFIYICVIYSNNWPISGFDTILPVFDRFQTSRSLIQLIAKVATSFMRVYGSVFGF